MAGSTKSRRALDAHAASLTPTWRGAITQAALLVVFPILYFWPYLIPQGVHPGNDFHVLYYRFKYYLIDVLSNGLPIPAWSPTEGAGYPFRANPFAAAHYPLNTLLAEFYVWAGGYSECDHVSFTLVAFPLFAIGMTLWLCVLGETRTGAVLSSLVFATSLKMSELIRFPNAAHAAAWIPWLLLGVTLACRRGYWLRGCVVCVVASYCLVTAGYPYYAYYSQFLVGPWLLLLLCPTTRRMLSDLPDESWSRPHVALLSISIGCGIAASSCFSYLREIKQMLAETTDRSGGDWDYATIHEWTLTDVLGCLIYPPRACMEGWYFFGITALAVIALFVWDQLTIPDKTRPNSRGFLKIIAGTWSSLTLITLGKFSPLFYVLWKFFPGFSSLRIWARMNVILLPVLCLLFCRSWNWWMKHASIDDPAWRRQTVRRLAAIAVGVLALQLLLIFATREEPYWKESFLAPGAPLVEWRHHLSWTVMVLGPVGIGLLALSTYSPWQPKRIGFALVLLMSAIETTGFGCLQWTNWQNGGSAVREILHIPKRLQTGFSSPRSLASTTVALNPTAHVGILENWYFQRYVSFLRKFAPRPARLSSEPGQLAEVPGMLEMLGVTNGKRLFFVSHLDMESPLEFVDAARDFERGNDCRASVMQFDGDQLHVLVSTKTLAYLCYIDNWDPTWTCTVNGKEVKIELLMGTFKAVPVPAGKSEVHVTCVGHSTHPN